MQFVLALQKFLLIWLFFVHKTCEQCFYLIFYQRTLTVSLLLYVFSYHLSLGQQRETEDS